MAIDNEAQPALSRPIIVYVPREMARAIAKAAADELISASAWLRQAARDRLQSQQTT